MLSWRAHCCREGLGLSIGPSGPFVPCETRIFDIALCIKREWTQNRVQRISGAQPLAEYAAIDTVGCRCRLGKSLHRRIGLQGVALRIVVSRAEGLSYSPCGIQFLRIRRKGHKRAFARGSGGGPELFDQKRITAHQNGAIGKEMIVVTSWRSISRSE